MAKVSAVSSVVALALVAGGGKALSRPAPAARAPTLCAAAEDSVFACAKGQKIISLCAIPAVNGGRSHLRYLYGAPGKLELDISRPEAFTWGVTALSGGGIDYVRVTNGDYAYVVYTGQTQTWSQDGWIVEAKGAAISHHICKGGATGPNVWASVYAAKLPQAPDSDSFSPPDWVGAAPRPSAP